MHYELLFAIVAFALTNTVLFSIYISRMSTKIAHIESDIASCKENDRLHGLKFDNLHRLEAQLELIITHMYPKKEQA